MHNSQIEALKIRWYKHAIAGNPIMGDDKKLFDSLDPSIQEELKKAYILGVNDETETWMTEPATTPTLKVLF